MKAACPADNKPPEGGFELECSDYKAQWRTLIVSFEALGEGPWILYTSNPRHHLPGRGPKGHGQSTQNHPPAPIDRNSVGTKAPSPDPPPQGISQALTLPWNGWSREASSSPGWAPKGLRAEPGSYMEKAWRSRRCAAMLAPPCPCSARSLGTGAGGAGPDCCRICEFSD